MKKLWQHGKINSVHKAIEAFTAGDDPALDLVLMPYDIKGSIAHAEGLKKIGILSTDETKKLVTGLEALHGLSRKGKVTITPGDEDCHTVIENFLTTRYGSVGKKIHTGRSRNDQVLTALRLYMKEKLGEATAGTEKLVTVFKKKSAEYRSAPMPGYTHMQRAMPSTADLWLGSFAAALSDDLALMRAAAKVLDQSPLGSVVGYGETTLGLDRKLTAQKLGFARVQDNPMYAALSRGKFELMALEALQPVMFDIGKFATDAMLFSTKEFGFLSLPAAFTTGSSAMPQKRNYDVLELMRAYAAAHGGRVQTLAAVIEKLPSGYNRDFQLTKKIFIEAVHDAQKTVDIATLVVQNLELDRVAMKSACTSELYATEEAYRLVKGTGMPFREAYEKVAKKYHHTQSRARRASSRRGR